MKRLRQRAMYCRCGRAKMLARGLCATCYTLKRQDTKHFGGLREAVLERDGYRCRVCEASGRDKRSIVVHHRVPGKSVLGLMISLCPACHARVHRTAAVLALMPPLLLELWREQHPLGHEQTTLDFMVKKPAVTHAWLFTGDREGSRASERLANGHALAISGFSLGKTPRRSAGTKPARIRDSSSA